jgi:hypothetical protein
MPYSIFLMVRIWRKFANGTEQLDPDPEERYGGLV